MLEGEDKFIETLKMVEEAAIDLKIKHGEGGAFSTRETQLSERRGWGSISLAEIEGPGFFPLSDLHFFIFFCGHDWPCTQETAGASIAAGQNMTCADDVGIEAARVFVK